MLTTSSIRNQYAQIQKQLFNMIPEKWDRVYLYASVIERYNSLQTGEMFFYYYPKGLLKKNPVNVYEVPNKFNIDEGPYLQVADKLFGELKKLRDELVKSGEKPWTNLTISIQDFKFTVEYDYENLINSKYTSYDRHLIWRHQYLGIPLTSYSKKERQMVEYYLSHHQTKNRNVNTYTEGIYQKPASAKVIEYNKEEQEEILEPKEEIVLIPETNVKSQILNFGEQSLTVPTQNNKLMK